MTAPTSPSFAFGRFRMEGPEGRLLLDGAELTLAPRLKQLLGILLEHPDEWLREEWLARAIWPKAVPPERELDRLLKELRDNLDRGADGVATIQSQAGRGHRLLIPVRVLVSSPASTAPIPIPATAGAPGAPEARRRERPTVPESGSAHRRVISPQRFALVLISAAVVAGLLGGALRWATRRAAGAAGSDAGNLTGSDPGAVSAAANAELAKGLAAGRGHDLAALNAAIARFERALAIEPGNARARAALAAASVRRGDGGRAKREAEAAIGLDPNLADAHAALAFARLSVDWNVSQARAAAERALAIDASHVVARRALAWTFAAEGRFVEAQAQLLQATSPGTPDPELASDRAAIFYLAGRSIEARQLLAGLLRNEPAYLSPHETLAAVHLVERRLGAAALELELVDALAAGATADDERIRLAAVGGWEPPNPSEAARLLQVRGEMAGGAGRVGSAGSAVWAARIFAQLGEPERAFAALRKAVTRRESGVVLAWVDPALASLRSGSAFRELMDRAGVPPPVPAAPER